MLARLGLIKGKIYLKNLTVYIAEVLSANMYLNDESLDINAPNTVNDLPLSSGKLTWIRSWLFYQILPLLVHILQVVSSM